VRNTAYGSRSAGYVRATWAILQQEEPDDYVIATCRTTSIRDVCRIAFKHLGLAMEDHVVIDPALFRPRKSMCFSATRRRREPR
jgi:GDP-D-mannose dehydratase